VAGRKKFDLKREYRKTTRQLADLNRDLAAKMILLASETGDTSPLIQAVDALQRADDLFSNEDTPRETAAGRLWLRHFILWVKLRTTLMRLSAQLPPIAAPLLWRR